MADALSPEARAAIEAAEGVVAVTVCPPGSPEIASGIDSSIFRLAEAYALNPIVKESRRQLRERAEKARAEKAARDEEQASGGKRRDAPNKLELGRKALALVSAGLSQAEACAQLGVSSGHLVRVLRLARDEAERKEAPRPAPPPGEITIAGRTKAEWAALAEAHTVREIAEKIGRSKAAVEQSLKRAGLKAKAGTPGRQCPKGVHSGLRREEWEALAREHDARKIAEMLGRDPSRVYRVLSKLGIKPKAMARGRHVGKRRPEIEGLSAVQRRALDFLAEVGGAIPATALGHYLLAGERGVTLKHACEVGTRAASELVKRGLARQRLRDRIDAYGAFSYEAAA